MGVSGCSEEAGACLKPSAKVRIHAHLTSDDVSMPIRTSRSGQHDFVYQCGTMPAPEDELITLLYEDRARNCVVSWYLSTRSLASRHGGSRNEVCWKYKIMVKSQRNVILRRGREYCERDQPQNLH